MEIKFPRLYTDHFRSGGVFQAELEEDLSDLEENRWKTFKDGLCIAANATLKYQEVNKKEWITEETLASMEERANVRAKLLNSKSEQIREQIQKYYDAKNKEVKNNARRDKRAFADQLAKEAEEAANIVIWMRSTR